MAKLLIVGDDWEREEKVSPFYGKLTICRAFATQWGKDAGSVLVSDLGSRVGLGDFFL